MSDAPGDVAAKLEALNEQSFDLAGTHDTIRAAASLLRDMSEREKALREALEPFARQAQIFDGAAGVAFDDQFEPFDLTINGHRIIGLTVGDLRRAAKALEAK